MEDGGGGLGGGEGGGVDGVGGDALVVRVAEVKATLGKGGIGQNGSRGGGRIDGLSGAAVEESLEGSGEVDNGGAGGLFEQETVAEGFRGTSPEGYDEVAVSEERGEGGGFEAAEVRFAAGGAGSSEDFGYGAAVTAFDFVVEIEEAPAEEVGE